MKETDIAKRLERLLSGTGEPRDLDAMFLWVRERKRSFGNRIIEDIGDFVAHSDQRTKGIAWNSVSRFADMATFVLPGQDVATARSLERLRSACQASLELHSEEEIRLNHNLRKTKARATLAKALDNIEYTVDGRLGWKRSPSKQEAELVRRLSSVLVVRAAFTEDELIDQFVTCISKNALVEHSRVAELTVLRSKLSLYVIEKMHLSRIVLRDGRTAELQAYADTTTRPNVELPPPLISVTGSVELQFEKTRVPISFGVYESTLDARDYCEPEILVPASRAWEFPLEIGPNWKLRMLP